MTNNQFILMMKSKLKEFYLENRSVGMELKELVEEFRQEAISDFCKTQKPKKSIKKSNWKNLRKWPH